MNSAEHIDEGNPSGLQQYLKMGIRRRWWFITSAVIFWAAALALSVIVPPKYKSETLVVIEPGDVPAQYVTSNMGLDLQQRLRSLTEQTLSHPRLAQLINELHLYGHTPGQVASENQVKQMRGDISVDLIKSNDRGEISAFKIIYSGSTPDQAQKVTSRLAFLFIQDSVDRQQRLSEDTTSFLATQLEEARNDMQRQESVLRQFRGKNLGELPEQQAANVQILSGLQDRLRSSTESLHQAEKQKLYLGSLMGWSANGTVNTAAADMIPAGASPVDEQIDKMKADLADLSARYTPIHPDVVRLKEQIANAEKIRSETARNGESARTGAAVGGAEIARSARVTSPLAQLQSQYKANELEITSRKQEIKALEKQIGDYHTRLNLAPVREQEIAQATRNYEQSRSHYESLLAKKQQSEMATDLSKMQKNGQFRTVDPPTLPQRPYWPNRLKFSAMGLFIGALFGLLGIALKETVDARIYGEDDLSRWVSLPVIGTVPPLITNAERKSQRRRRGVEIAIASVLVALVPALTMMAYLKG